MLGNQHRDTILYILQFLHLDEWCGILYLCKNHWNVLSPYMLKFIKNQLRERLKHKITQLGIDTNPFFELIQKYSGQVTGSIHLEMLIENFKSNDIDIFITSPTCIFTDLHRFLYFYSTGDQSIPGKKWNDDISKVREVTRQEIIPQMEKVRASRYFTEIIREFTTKYEIRNIFTYIIQACKIQVITIGKVKKDNTNKIWKLCEECDIKEYITTQFDMEMSMSMYDGIDYKLHGLLNVYNRHLIFPEYFKQRVMFVSNYEKKRHLRRLKKYETRGFKIIEPLQYSLYENEIHCVKEDQELPISEVIEIIQNKRQKIL